MRSRGLADGVVPVVAKQSPRRVRESLKPAGDAVTADILTEVSRDVDKLLWLVEAHAHT